MSKYITAEFLKELAKRPESETLDVKGDQYLFKGANDDDKSEVLKDILAFANAFVSEDAFILLGIREGTPPPHQIVGISSSIDDASLQTFANAKLVICPKFSYEEVNVDGMTVGVIRIPPQQGPFVVKRDYGRLQQAQIPVRQGTATLFKSHSAYSQLAQERERAATLDAVAPQLNAVIDQAVKNRLVSLQAAAESADTTFDRCTALLRQGDVDGAVTEIERVLTNTELMQAMSDQQRARSFRIKANLLLRQNDLLGAQASLDQADLIANEDEPRIHAMVAMHRSGVEEAIRVLGDPKTEDGRQLAAQLLVSAGRPTEALQVLSVDEPPPTNALRPQALAKLLLGDREVALASAAELLDREPTWLESQTTAGMAHFFSALSPAFKSEQVFSPDIVPPPLFRADQSAFEHLADAERHFRSALSKPIPPYEILNLELWLLAVLTLQPDRRDDANAVLASIMAREPTHTIAVLWAISYSLEFDREQTRQRCLENLSGDSPQASDVVTYLVLEQQPSDESLDVLIRHEKLFREEGQLRVFEFWRARLKEEIDGVDSSTEELSVHGLIARATDSGNWSDVEELLKNSPDDPVILAISAEALADAHNWAPVAKLAPRLVKEIGTEFAFRLAATALLNSGDARGCIEVVQEWESRFTAPDLPSVGFWRLRSAALAQLGDVTGAIESVTTLLKKASSPRDIGHAADIYLRVGDVRSAAPHIADLIRQGEVAPDEAINWSRAVQHDDQALAEALLDHAAEKGVPDASAGSAYEMAVRLNREDLSGKFLGAMAAAANKPGTGIQSATSEDAIQWMRDRQARAADVNDLYLKGEIPLALACSETNDNIALRFEAAFAAYRSEDWIVALLIFHGNRSQTRQDLPDLSDWIVCLDITTLLVLDELNLLEVVQESARSVRLPFELPGALLELEDDLGRVQPERLATLLQVIEAVSVGKFQSGLSNVQGDNTNRVCRVVLDAEGADDSWPNVDLRELFDAATESGVLDREEADSALASFQRRSEERTQTEIPNHPILLFDGNAIEIALKAFGVQRLSDFATCVVDPEYLRIIRGEAHLAELRKNALERVARIRHSVSKGIQSDTYTLLPQLDVNIASQHAVSSSLEAVMLSLLSQPKAEGYVVAFDDRLLNKHLSTDHHPIVCTLDIVEYLSASGVLSAEAHLETKAKIRDKNLFFARPGSDDVAYALSGAITREDELVETPRMRALRKYVARSQSLHQYLDLQQRDGPPNESQLALATFRLAANAIEAVFADKKLDLTTAKANANWIWKYLRLTTDRFLPISNRTPSSVRYLLAVQLSSLLSSAMTIFMVSRRSDRDEWMRSHIRWVWEECIFPYLEGNNDLVSQIAAYLRHCTDPLLERGDEISTEDEREAVQKFTRAHVAHFVTALPTELRQEVLSDGKFAARFGISVESVAEIADVMIEEGEFRRSLIEAASQRGEISLDTKSGPATVRVAKKGTSRRPPVVEFAGALSLKYEEPILGIFGANRDESLAEFLNGTDWVDLPPSELDYLQRSCQRQADDVVFSVLDDHRRRNVQHYYQKLAGSMARRETLSKPDFDAPESGLMLGSMRLPVKTRKRLSFLIDLAIDSLVSQYGAIEAFSRMCGLPIDLASRFVGPIAELIDEHPRATKSWLLKSDGSVLGRVHKLAICAALADRGLITIAAVRQSLRSFLQDWPDAAKLFLQVLRTYDQLQSQVQHSSELPAAQRLIVLWVHSERISRIVGKYLSSVDEGADYFKKIASRALAGEMLIDKAYEKDAASPDILFDPVLLFFGMSYVHSNCTKLISRPLFKLIDELLRFTNDEAAPLSPRLLQGRDNSLDSLDSFLSKLNKDFVEKYNSVNKGRAQSPGWFAERQTEISDGTISGPSDSLLWSEVLAYEQRFLEAPIRLRLLELVEKIDWTDLIDTSEEAAICALMLASDMVAYLDDESKAIEIAGNILANSHSASQVEPNLEHETETERRLTFKQAVVEIAFRMSRSANLARSCRVLAANLQTLINLDNKWEGDIVYMLEVAIPLLPVEHVLPLVELRRSLRTRI